MLVLVCYDVATSTARGARRLRRVARVCEAYGQRVQYSVFECEVDPAQWEEFKSKLSKVLDPKTDSLRFYLLGANWERRVETIGLRKAPGPRDLLLLDGEDGDDG